MKTEKTENTEFKTMDVIISTSCEFNNDADVAEYNALDEIEVPEDDMHWTTCTKIVMGYARIFLYFTDKKMVVYQRRDVTGMAVDGHAVAVHGPEFRRLDTDGYQFPGLDFEATKADDSADSANATEETTEATETTEETEE